MRTLCESTFASAHSSRCTSCSLDISRLSTSTRLWSSTPAYLAMFSAKAVLPMEGRPAMMMKSLDWKPEVMRSSLSKPVARPVMCSFRS